uniref:Uncharacterized protein n=1 Tax=Knipowitschia caucasica TaxID=637954 RepID=A0AAV2KHE5_KNICA
MLPHEPLLLASPGAAYGQCVGPSGDAPQRRTAYGAACVRERVCPTQRTAVSLRAGPAADMSSYFVNSLFSKYKSGESLRPNYYECGFAQELAGSRPTVVYGPGSGASFQHAPQIQDFYHHSASTLPTNPYQQSPCAVTCHGEPGNFYGYDALQRQTLFGAQDADLVQYSDCKLSTAPGLTGEDGEGTDQSPSPTQLFPWMRPQAHTLGPNIRVPQLHGTGKLEN